MKRVWVVGSCGDWLLVVVLVGGGGLLVGGLVVGGCGLWVAGLAGWWWVGGWWVGNACPEGPARRCGAGPQNAGFHRRGGCTTVLFPQLRDPAQQGRPPLSLNS